MVVIPESRLLMIRFNCSVRIMDLKKQALAYHQFPTPGKVAIRSTKPCETSMDLSLAYSPGVAEPCLEIADKPEDVYNYTSKGNLVAVISNGTAVLGLGNIGPAASKPVMEGKGVLFKAFADIDVFDLEVDCTDIDKFCETVKYLEPTFGGINLEDIKAPECFHIEERLIKEMDIPVFHDDQHGTAIIAAAAIKNALEVVGKDMSKVRLVVSGAGAAAIASCRLICQMGMKKENLMLCDSKGVVYKGREAGMNEFKEEFAVDTDCRTLEDAMKGADVFFGLSAADILKPEMLKTMSDNPIVFAMSNPNPEINYELAVSTRDDVIMATGRSDYPNQVNNVLGFPFIFRGALDVRASKINNEMKLAAVEALATLAKEAVPANVRCAYGNAEFSFGREYLIPKPFDPRVLYYVSPAVAKAAMETGVARKDIDLDEYTLKLKGQENKGRQILRHYHSVARKSKNKKIVFAEGSDEQVIRAAHLAAHENIAEPILVGNKKEIEGAANKLDLKLDKIEVVDPSEDSNISAFGKELQSIDRFKSLSQEEAEAQSKTDHIYSCMMVREGKADGMISGVGRPFPETVKPIFSIVGLKDKVKTASGLYIVSVKGRLFFINDTAINIEMDSEKLASITLSAAKFTRSMGINPRVALLSFSNFGSVNHDSVNKLRNTLEIVKKADSDLEIDGEMQADTAVDEILNENYPDCKLSKPANVLIFPDMQSGNICMKMMQRLGGAKVIGPIILGLNRPAYVLPKHADSDEIFNLTTVAVAQAELG